MVDPGFAESGNIRRRNVLYSWRKAAIGSRRAAFTAGQRPKNRPTLVATLNPATTLHSGTVEGRLGTKVRMATESSQPAKMPIRPPKGRFHYSTGRAMWAWRDR